MRPDRAVLLRLRVYLPRLMAFIESELPLSSCNYIYTDVPLRQHKIPNVVYQTWTGKHFGRSHARYLAEFRRRNSDFSFKFFDDSDIDAYMHQYYGDEPIYQVYKSARLGPLKTDIWRYCILCERGGVYCDIDKFIDVPIGSLISGDTETVITYENNIYIGDGSAPGVQHPDHLMGNYALMFRKGHPLLRLAIAGIVSKYPSVKGVRFKDPKRAVMGFTGPIHLTDCLHALANTAGLGFANQVGIDFGQKDVYIPGAWTRYIARPSYATSRNAVIVD
jgi:mannosyltransferase OCH1-like enzyme